jgi:predicted Rossmann fold flavoprotein
VSSPTPPSFDVVVIGAGAAGLMAALWAARDGAKVVVVDGAAEAGRKILISGGGRCNLLPSEARDPAEASFHTSGSRNVLKRLFKTWRLPQLQDFFRWELDLPLVEEDDGKLFPESGKARDVRDALVAEAEGCGAEFRYGWRVGSVERAAAAVGDGAGGFLIHCEGQEALHARRLVLATGGESVPQTGSDGFGLRIAKTLGHKPLPTFPALVPLTTEDEELKELAGLSLPVAWRASVDGRQVAEGERGFLFTHKGFSGPAVLDASHYVIRDGAEIHVSWDRHTRQDWIDFLRSRARRGIARTVADVLPNRLAALLVERSGVRGEMRCGNLTRSTFDALLEQLCDFTLPVSGDRGFEVAEVTGGGIPLEELQPSTLESRKVPGLYLCGEMLDVFGDIGGFNFMWAFITGRLAGECAARPPHGRN